MTKNYFTRLLQASLMCCLAVILTGCDDMFGSEDNPIPAYLSMNTSDVTLMLGETNTRTAIAVSTAIVEYSSSNPAIATVDQQGTVKAVSKGTATITATATGYSSASGTKMFNTETVSYKVNVILPDATITKAPTAIAGIKAGEDKAIVTAGEAGGGKLKYAVTTTNTKPTTTEGFSTTIPTAAARAAGTYYVWYYAEGDPTHADSEIAAAIEVKVSAVVDLSELTAAYEAKDGETLTGTLSGNYKISIAAEATVTLDGVTINGVNDENCKWAGINCEGNATIILKDGSTNTVKGFQEDYPGIHVKADYTLTIKGETAGTGSLTATGSTQGAGIGAGNWKACGNIVIEGGTINATAGGVSAGIGGGNNGTCGTISITGGNVTAVGVGGGAGIGGGNGGSCGNISITGGKVTATGGLFGAGIGAGSGYSTSTSSICGNINITGGDVTATGGGYSAGIGTGPSTPSNSIISKCGNITITSGVTKVMATKGSTSPNSIGIGGNGTTGYNGICGTVTIGGTVGTITTSPYTYQP